MTAIRDWRRFHTTVDKATVSWTPSSSGMMSRAVANSDTAVCNKTITSHCLKALYNVGDYKADANNGSKTGFASYLEEWARYSDLQLFKGHLALYAIGQNFTVVKDKGGKNEQHSGIESSKANLVCSTSSA